jgi:PAS domain S-box-containing protein
LGIALIDSLTGHIYAVNPMFAGIAGRTMEEMAHVDWMSITHPDDVKKDLENMALLNAGKIAGFQMEKRYLHPDGAVVWINMTIAPVQVVDKAHPRHLCMIENITDHKAAEEALRESERKYRFLVANAHEAIFIAQDNVVKFPNGKALEMTGYSTEELAGVPFTDLIHPEDKGTVQERYIDRLRGEPPRETYPFRIMKKTGEEIWVQLAAELIDWEGRPGVLCFLRDITKERNQDAQLMQAQKMEAVGTLAGGIAHDFNNALTGIVGFGELLRMRMAGDEQALHDLDEILRCAERAATLTRQLLTFARRQIIDPVNLNLNALVADLMKLICKVVGEHIEVKTSLEKTVPSIHADHGQIEQVVMNLCLNARDAMSEGGRLVVETEDVFLDDEYVRQNPYMRTGRYTLLTVSDTGIGMDEKTCERVFEPFFTTKGLDKGTGLGLSMVYGIVKQHGGFIHLYSEPGKGTVFKVYFPAIEAQPDAVPEKRREETVRGGTETILLAEDEEAIRALAERILTGFGYTVLVARDGEEAIEIFRRKKEIVLAVLDVVMPRKGGKEAFEEMCRQNPRLKVIFMSGYSADAIHDSFVLIPGMPFLQKPFGPTILARKVREVLDA